MRLTPGPWKLKFHMTMNEWTRMYWVNDRTSIGTENPDDAKLMALAPEMLQTLRSVHASLDNIDPVWTNPDMKAALECTQAMLKKVEAA